MTVTLESWYIIAFIALLGIAVIFVIGHFKRRQYEDDVRGKIKAVIQRGTGWPFVKIVKESIDGWVTVEKGEYKLPVGDEQRKAFEEMIGKGMAELTDEERVRYFGQRKTMPTAMEWNLYPDKPFPTAKQVPIRTQRWYENDPRPITWLRDNQPAVTSAVSKAHTLQMNALEAGVRTQELETQSRKMMEGLASMAQRNTLFIVLIIASIVIGVINLYLTTHAGTKLPLLGG